MNWYKKAQNLNGLWYHGSVRNFDTFKPYSWFTTNKDLAANYISWETAGRPAEILYTVKLSVSNPLDLSGYDMDEELDLDGATELIVDMGIPVNNSDALNFMLHTERPFPSVSTSQVVNKDMRKIKNHDSILIPESGAETICVFNPKNITIVSKE